MYEKFACVYDALMASTPYDAWADYIDTALMRHFCGKKCEEILVLDLACGTGAMALRLAETGYDVIGADASEDMLAMAYRKAYDAGRQILFIRQDMRRLELFGTVDAAVSVCDGLNYILDKEDLLAVFKRVRLFLNPGGIFIFDMNTEYKFKEMFGEKVLAGDGAGGEGYEWENFYDPDSQINEYRLTFFSADGEKFDEIHRQRAYPPMDICNMLLDAGFSSAKISDCYSDNPPRTESWKVTFTAKT